MPCWTQPRTTSLRAEAYGQPRLTKISESTMVDDMEVDVLHLPKPVDTENALAAVVAMRRAADRLELAAVQCAIDKNWTWVEIADALGVTKQAVHKRYARRIERAHSNPKERK